MFFEENIPFKGREPVRGNTTMLCDALPLRRQIYG